MRAGRDQSCTRPGAPLFRTPIAWSTLVGAAALYAFAVVALTWPLFRHPATRVLDCRSLYGDAWTLIQRDVNLTMWTLAWDSHALVTNPLGVFDANSFYPARNTLALTEHMLGNVPLFTPVYLTTGNPVLAHQTALLLSFVIAGLTMAAFVLYWTDDRVSALVAGFMFAFSPYRFWQLGNLHVISIEYLPLVLLGIDATLDRRGGRLPLVCLGLGLALSTLCSYYIGYAAFLLAGVYAVVGALVRGRERLSILVPIAGAAVVAAAAIGTITVPYLLLQHSAVLPDYRDRGFSGLAFLGMLKVGWYGLLAYFILPRRSGIPQFLTGTGMLLAVIALARRRDVPRAALVAVGAAGVLLSLGPYLLVTWTRTPIPLPYRMLMAIVPGFSAMRVPQRFGALATLTILALAGFGLATVRRTLTERGRTWIAATLPCLVVALFAIEATPGGLAAFPMLVGNDVPPVYRWLAAHGDGGAVLELPTGLNDLHRQSTYMYYSTYHWLPMANGYAAYPPRSYVDIMTAVKGLPQPDALRTVLDLAPLHWILLHRSAIGPRFRPQWDEGFATVPVAAEFGDDVVYDVHR